MTALPMAGGGQSGAGCCAPQPTDRSNGQVGPAAGGSTVQAADGAPRTEGMVRLSAVTFLMGSRDAWAEPGDGEAPVHEVSLRPYAIDRFAVSNAEFAGFVDAVGYLTDAERFGWSYVFAGLLPAEVPATRAVAGAPWWRQVPGASWRHPEGPRSDLAGRRDHPVVHVSWTDARAYAGWAGKRLPTEAEWEYAARGGLEQRVFPWGDEFTPGGEHRMNVWQGSFPDHNTGDDGWYGTAPVAAYPPNGHGLFNMCGNVWEWCADWFSPGYYTESPRHDPPGPPAGAQRVIRGGSYLCHASYCRRYRVAARSASTPDSSTGHQGFRCARDAPARPGA